MSGEEFNKPGPQPADQKSNYPFDEVEFDELGAQIIEALQKSDWDAVESLFHSVPADELPAMLEADESVARRVLDVLTYHAPAILLSLLAEIEPRLRNQLLNSFVKPSGERTVFEYLLLKMTTLKADGRAKLIDILPDQNVLESIELSQYAKGKLLELLDEKKMRDTITIKDESAAEVQSAGADSVDETNESKFFDAIKGNNLYKAKQILELVPVDERLSLLIEPRPFGFGTSTLEWALKTQYPHHIFLLLESLDPEDLLRALQIVDSGGNSTLFESLVYRTKSSNNNKYKSRLGQLLAPLKNRIDLASVVRYPYLRDYLREAWADLEPQAPEEVAAKISATEVQADPGEAESEAVEKARSAQEGQNEKSGVSELNLAKLNDPEEQEDEFLAWLFDLDESDGDLKDNSDDIPPGDNKQENDKYLQNSPEWMPKDPDFIKALEEYNPQAGNPDIINDVTKAYKHHEFAGAETYFITYITMFDQMLASDAPLEMRARNFGDNGELNPTAEARGILNFLAFAKAVNRAADAMERIKKYIETINKAQASAHDKTEEKGGSDQGVDEGAEEKENSPEISSLAEQVYWAILNDDRGQVKKLFKDLSPTPIVKIIESSFFPGREGSSARIIDNLAKFLPEILVEVLLELDPEQSKPLLESRNYYSGRTILSQLTYTVTFLTQEPPEHLYNLIIKVYGDIDNIPAEGDDSPNRFLKRYREKFGSNSPAAAVESADQKLVPDDSEAPGSNSQKEGNQPDPTDEAEILKNAKLYEVEGTYETPGSASRKTSPRETNIQSREPRVQVSGTAEIPPKRADSKTGVIATPDQLHNNLRKILGENFASSVFKNSDLLQVLEHTLHNLKHLLIDSETAAIELFGALVWSKGSPFSEALLRAINETLDTDLSEEDIYEAAKKQLVTLLNTKEPRDHVGPNQAKRYLEGGRLSRMLAMRSLRNWSLQVYQNPQYAAIFNPWVLEKYRQELAQSGGENNWDDKDRSEKTQDEEQPEVKSQAEQELEALEKAILQHSEGLTQTELVKLVEASAKLLMRINIEIAQSGEHTSPVDSIDKVFENFAKVKAIMDSIRHGEDLQQEDRELLFEHYEHLNQVAKDGKQLVRLRDFESALAVDGQPQQNKSEKFFSHFHRVYMHVTILNNKKE